jgi:hypothetical protein
MTKERITFCLDLDVGTDPIAGSVRTMAGDEHAFIGWLELVNALERAGWHGLPDDLPTQPGRRRA